VIGRLEKMQIRNLDTDQAFHVLFNPSEYTVSDGARWSDQNKLGQKPELHFTGGERKKLDMELFFDTYEAGRDVREETSKVAALLVVDREKHRPPKVRLSWGRSAPGGAHRDFPFTGVLESLKQQFVLFTGDGTPARAKLTVSFLEFTLPEEELKKNERNSPDHTKAYVTRAGDTASSIAALFLGDPRRWRPIVEANAELIDDPRVIPTGLVLSIPKVE